MYLQHYSLKEKPFEMSPGPRFLWLGEKHLEALATLKYGISEGKGFLLLTGDVGVGKTALIHRLINETDESKLVAYIPNPGLEPLDFFNILAIELEINQKFTSKGAFLIEFKKFLYKKHSEKKKVLLVIDEAQRLYHELLEEIRLLSNIELENRKLINIFFVGQPEFNQILLQTRNRALRQRIAVRYQVAPLNPEETSKYIQHRLMVAGTQRQIFNSNAISEIFRFSKGCPRLINVMCDHALLTGYSSGLKTIHSNVIRECEPELKIPEDYSTIPQKPPSSENLLRKPVATPPSVESIPHQAYPPSTSQSKYRIHPILIGFLGILVGFMGYYLLWPKTHRSMQQTPLHELTQPLDDKTEAILGDRSGANVASVEQPSQAIDETIPETPKLEVAQNTVNSDIPKSTPELLADNQTDAEIQSPSIQDSLNDNPVNNGTPLMPPKEDTTSDKRIDQVDERSSPILKEKQPVRDESKVGSEDKLVSDPTENSNVEDSTDKSIANAPEQKSVADSKFQPLPPSLVVKNDSQIIKESLINNQENNTELNQTETSLSKQPSDSENLPQEKIVTQAKPFQLAESSDSPINKQNKAFDSTPKEQEKPTIDNPKKKLPQEVSNQNLPPLVKKEKPVPPAKKNVEAPKGKNTLAKFEPVVETKTNNNRLEDRVRSFLKQYCNTYASKELGNFARLFGPDAKENGKSFSTLLPKYQRNFNAIEKIEYRIDLLKFSFEENINVVKIEGKFFLKWRPYGQSWRENSGKIYMDLNERGQSFLVHRLEYYGDRRK
jgi:general secretion pathway protein A